ncbi:uncharacterized protein LOC135218481 [Macrobrachium nipponense]|uniref:uncharacterized protein LOC135218481 n=1 Tax=Macrobrachium nipponense TaxID=159736 RepID=UPI0030C8BD40
MGNRSSKRKQFADPLSGSSDFVKAVNFVSNEAAAQNAASLVERWEAWQLSVHSEVLQKMREDYIYRPNSFLLNLLTLSLQFYKNFPREKPSIFKYMRDRESVLGENLSQFRRHVLYTNGYEEICGSHILYFPEDDPYPELCNRQVYIVQENIEVYPEDMFEELQRAEKDSDETVFRFCSESSRKHVGYVRLRSIDACREPSSHDDIYGELHLDPSLSPRGTSRDSGISVHGECSATEEERKSKGDDELEHLRKKLAAIDECSEECVEDDPPESEEATKVSLKRRWSKVSVSLKEKYLHGSDDQQPSGSSNDRGEEGEESLQQPTISVLIHPRCFTNRRIVIRQKGDVYGTQTQRETRTYLLSERYYDRFKDDFENLVKIMDKEHLLSNDLMELHAALVTNEMIIKNIGPRVKTEFIPTVEMKSWPLCAFEWRLRERRTLSDPVNKTMYRWPKSETITQVLKLGCNLVPLGHHSDFEQNPARVIEWQIQFAKAEQLLMKTLGHTQIRLLLIVEHLLRDSREEVSRLSLQIYRHLVFWMCEHNFRDWQEERLGTKVKSFLKFFYSCLRKRNLPHYFINKCNLLETLPEQSLRRTQVLLRNMMDNLPLYLMHTITRMGTEDEYYEIISAEEIYDIVAPTKFTIAHILPMLLLRKGDSSVAHSGSDGEDETNDIHHLQLKMELHRLREERAKKKPSKSKNVSFKDETKPKPRRGAKTNTKTKTKTESTIDLSPKRFSAEKIRSERLVTLFAYHFVGMAHSSNEFECYSQAFMYHLLAKTLVTLLEEMKRKVGQDLKQKISHERKVCLEGIQGLLKDNWVMSDAGDIMSTAIHVSGFISEMNTTQEAEPAPAQRNTFPLRSGSSSSSESIEESHL